MPDFEKTVNELEEIRSYFRVMAAIAQTNQGRDEHLESARSIDDAIALLKAQEPVAPIEHYIPDEAHRRRSLAWECGNCLIDIGYGVNYCYNCGRAVKWDG